MFFPFLPIEIFKLKTMFFPSKSEECLAIDAVYILTRAPIPYSNTQISGGMPFENQQLTGAVRFT
jgi:hypothetical protein